MIDQPTRAPTRKVTAGALGSGVVGIPLAALIVGSLSAAGVALPAGTEAALGALLSSMLGFVAAYFTREHA
jgi:uncharacterized MnhB-related membrane protein